MATKRDIEIASLLFRSGIATQEEIQSALGYQGKLLTEGTVKTLVEILVERELLPADSGHTFSDEPLEKTQPLDNYEIHALRGEGASARVYEATYKPKDLRVALKVLHPEQELQAKTRRRFMREAHLLCKLRHPQIVRGYEVRKVNGYRYLAMQWVEGYELLEIIDKRGRLDDTTALHAARQIASALSYLYSKGIVHRDIKPGNVLTDNDWNMWLIDLGLCRLINAEGDEAAGTTVGTVGYISPEQAKGVDDLDIRSDIYSLGVSLYHMVTGNVPFSGDDDFEVMSKQILQSLGSDQIKSLNISPHVHYAIEKMMAKDRDLRFQHPDEIVTELDAYLDSVGYKPIPTAGAADEEEEQAKSKNIEIVSKKRRGSSSGTRKSYTRRRRRR
ncbi:MAG: serine/threonine protein kinase [Planctomycetota bacterium]|jgi:serine/threonine-protein kinase